MLPLASDSTAVFWRKYDNFMELDSRVCMITLVWRALRGANVVLDVLA